VLSEARGGENIAHTVAESRFEVSAFQQRLRGAITPQYEQPIHRKRFDIKIAVLVYITL
jgi:hypothetical protein